MPDVIDCPEHGVHALCLACLHISELAADSFLSVGDDELPVALCDPCDAGCEGDWTGLDADALDPLCEACFWHRQGLLDPTADPLLEGNLKALAVQEMGARGAQLDRELGREPLPLWRWRDDATLELSDARGVPVHHLMCDHLGSWSDREQRFVWAFENPSVPSRQRARAWQLRGLAERLDLRFIHAGAVTGCTLATAWILANIGGLLVGARAIRCLDLGDLKLFVAVQEAWPALAEAPPPAWAPGTDPRQIVFSGD